MSDTFQCGDQGALVGYLYGECEPSERDTIAAHVKKCLSCAAEIDTLSATRRTLSAWTPPAMTLGFQITSSQAVAPTGKVLERKVPWWRAPLPAWAQAAAALVIFAAGLSMGLSRDNTQSQPPLREASTLSDTPSATPATVSRDDLTRVEERLRAEMAQLRTVAPTPVATRQNSDDVMQQVKTLLEQSEARQRSDFTLRMVDLASSIETQRRVDLATVRQTMGTMQGVTGTEVRQQREAIDRINTYLINNVSQPTR
ncbi:MAG TPA: hypothetical protein VI485_22115 [Vicinamibacterales bacterium]|nr:hypothetical protein [Vicinamibacterales bacterium]